MDRAKVQQQTTVKQYIFLKAIIVLLHELLKPIYTGLRMLYITRIYHFCYWTVKRKVKIKLLHYVATQQN